MNQLGTGRAGLWFKIDIHIIGGVGVPYINILRNICVLWGVPGYSKENEATPPSQLNMSLPPLKTGVKIKGISLLF